MYFYSSILHLSYFYYVFHVSITTVLKSIKRVKINRLGIENNGMAYSVLQKGGSY